MLTGELTLPESDKAPADNSERVQIGAQIAPKVRLAYDLIKRRYGVSVTDIINMAPLFFTLLADSGSLAAATREIERGGGSDGTPLDQKTVDVSRIGYSA